MTLAIISRADARRAGLKTYFTGKPCVRGHVAERHNKGGDCVECKRFRAKKRTFAPGYQRARKLAFRYGITQDEYDAMLESQGHSCKVCLSPDAGSKYGWHVDHCHASGRVRGVLCAHCNRALGGARDSIETLQAMIEYLRESMQ